MEAVGFHLPSERGAESELAALAQPHFGPTMSLTATQKRYLAAIKGLAEVRKLAIPVFQVNIAKRQVNLASGSAPN